MSKHIFWMIVGCGIPILLLFFAPLLGLGSSLIWGLAVLAMLACHILMIGHHQKQIGHKDQ